MEEFRPLIEKRGIVFIAFQHHEFALRAGLKTRSEILRHTAYEERWFTAARLERPRHERGRGRFSMRTADDDRCFPLDHLPLEKFRHGNERQTPLEHGLYFFVPSRHRVAD